MTKSIQHIKQELENLESTTAEAAVDLQDRYRNYLELLSQSVQQQLILASYQICTQFYPQAFLELSLSNKQDLQQTLRQIGLKIKPNLLTIVEQQELEGEPNEFNLMAELIKNLPKAKRKDSSSEDEENEKEVELPEVDLETVKAELENIEFIEIDASENDDSEDLGAKTESEPLKTVDFGNPEDLILWHKQIERKIKKNLDIASKKVNKCLQDSKIIPARIPTKVIDVAIQAESSKRGKNNRKLQNAPNVLHLAIESERGKNSSSKADHNSTQISLLRLRLAEIEFSDPMLNAQRGKIRNMMSKISKLHSQHQATQHQVAVAEAQAAWRSSWYED